jgi:hypothetical protein
MMLGHVLIPSVTAPNVDDFIGVSQAFNSSNNLTVIWNAPSKGVFEEYEVFYKKTPGEFNFSQAETTVLYERAVVTV